MARRKPPGRPHVRVPTPPAPTPAGAVPVTVSALVLGNSYGMPAFAYRGYYLDEPFRCLDCGSEQVWTAAQQQWWYEVAKGYAFSLARRCRACRHAQCDARAATRAATLAGLARKRGT